VANQMLTVMVGSTLGNCI